MQQQREGAEQLSAAKQASAKALQVQVEEMDAMRRLLRLMADRSDRAAESRAAKQVSPACTMLLLLRPVAVSNGQPAPAREACM